MKQYNVSWRQLKEYNDQKQRVRMLHTVVTACLSAIAIVTGLGLAMVVYTLIS